MIKITCKRILGLIGSLALGMSSSAKQINIQFENGESFYTSPVVYLTGEDGQTPNVAVKDGIPTTAGVDANEVDFTKFTSVTFDYNFKSDNTALTITPILSNTDDPFCKQLNFFLYFSAEGNKILLPSAFPKLTTSASCHLKLFL